MAKSAAELQAEWWDGWWAADFSWEGLAKHPVGANGDVVHGGLHGEMDLQAYWRRDPETGEVRDDAAMRAAGELVSGPDGRDWHIAHMPMHWQDGSPAKSGWDEVALSALMVVNNLRIIKATKTGIDHLCSSDEPDGRAQLSGTVLAQALFSKRRTSSLFHAVCDWSFFVKTRDAAPMLGAGFRCCFANFFDGTNFARTAFLGYANFSHAIFSGDTFFSSAAFSEDAIFYYTTFSGNVNFDAARFRRYAQFNCTTFAASARFNHAIFSSSAWFDMAIFSSISCFDSSTFSKTARFESTKFAKYATFDGAMFAGRAYFESATFPSNVKFDRANFAELTSFEGANFAGQTDFHRSSFSGRVKFDSAVFSDIANFDSAIFLEYTSFDRAAFYAYADFIAGESKSQISFRNTNFGRPEETEPLARITFRGWRFSGVAEFRNATFAGHVEFKAATFNRLASFRGITWPEKFANWHGIFSQAVFRLRTHNQKSMTAAKAQAERKMSAHRS